MGGSGFFTDVTPDVRVGPRPSEKAGSDHGLSGVGPAAIAVGIIVRVERWSRGEGVRKIVIERWLDVS